jgi:hypothetical protein
MVFSMSILCSILTYTQAPKDSQVVDPVLGLSGTFRTALHLRSVSPAANSFRDWVYAKYAAVLCAGFLENPHSKSHEDRF